MQVPETPQSIEELDLMRQLNQYADGKASWFDEAPGPRARQACRVLYTQIVQFVHSVISPWLNQINTRAMDTFTLHDRVHALKVAHLMWYIMRPARRASLTPPEIGLLVLAAHLHDLGMLVRPDQRQALLVVALKRTAPGIKEGLSELRRRRDDPSLSESEKERAGRLLAQAEEALLCEYVREQHATDKRYREILGELRKINQSDPANFPNPDSVLSFQGDSFLDLMIEICVSHNEDAEVLVRKHQRSLERYRFPTSYPLGDTDADLHMVAAALRLADILDFDRERTPAALFQYLMPGPLAPEGNHSVLEWGKHLAISNWHVEENAVVFRGSCQSNIVHHAIVQFCDAIAAEIEKTRLTFDARGRVPWPFQLPASVRAKIEPIDYTYVEYGFELDDQRIYDLLMGGAIYDNPLVAVRELVQNAVDACQFRDAVVRLQEDGRRPDPANRISIIYRPPGAECPHPRLTVRDKGIGMSKYILETYFLRVGQSYYRSKDFDRCRIDFQLNDVDFAPVAEFGIGFLSCFLLAARLQVETAMAEPLYEDTRKRTLIIDGPTRLIRLSEEPNQGAQRFVGTAVTLYLTRGGKLDPKSRAPQWIEIKRYLEENCQELPYDIQLQYDTASDGVIRRGVKPLEVRGDRKRLLWIPVDDGQGGFEGEVAIEKVEDQSQLMSHAGDADHYRSTLIRGGFKIGEVPGVPYRGAYARVRMTWDRKESKRYLPCNLPRTAPADFAYLRQCIARAWIKYLLDRSDEISNAHAVVAYRPELSDLTWLDTEYSALPVYQFARKGWIANLGMDETYLHAWEDGRDTTLDFQDGFYLHDLLLGLILPRITAQVINDQGRFQVKSPRKVGGRNCGTAATTCVHRNLGQCLRSSWARMRGGLRCRTRRGQDLMTDIVMQSSRHLHQMN